MLALLLLQSVPSVVPEYGIPTGIAGLVLYFWRQDRKDREIERKGAEDRYKTLAEDFRRIVQDNTTAIARLSDTLDHRVMQCPLMQRPEELFRLMASVEAGVAAGPSGGRVDRG